MTAAQIKEDFSRISPFLDERTTRLYVSNMALRLGRGGRLLVSKALGVSRVRINNGIKELLGDVTLASEVKIRRKGGGRKSIDIHQPEMQEQIESIISPQIVSDFKSSMTNILICPTFWGLPFFVVLPSTGVRFAITKTLLFF